MMILIGHGKMEAPEVVELALQLTIPMELWMVGSKSLSLTKGTLVRLCPYFRSEPYSLQILT